ncbi:hypothetical protein VKT23_013404 [Stygiomarasmius scandens]|uniref:Uncharacterized protein n=1 Tax=Marasmiellus scandens TaxID=2682957 RepID=A0ABR1J3X5_9AGAR
MVVVLTVPDNGKGIMAIDFITIHLKLNSLLATLNARNHLRSLDRPVSTANTEMRSNQLQTRPMQFVAVESSSSDGRQESSEKADIANVKETFVLSDFSMVPDQRTGNFV